MIRQRARASPPPVFPASEFTGYERLENPACVIGIRIGGEAAERVEQGKTAEVVLDRTPFYAESGGQVGDTGILAGQGLRFEVRDTQQTSAGRSHIGVVAEGTLSLGNEVTATVDAARRRDIVLNHSATHLMNAALRKVLGKHVAQKGSLVAPDRLRFDFSHFEAVSPEDLERIEDEVNGQIRANAPAETAEMPLDDAIRAGALSMAGEDYAEKVRVLKLGDYSMELCGGTHVGRTGDIGLFAIVSESSVAAGVRPHRGAHGCGGLRVGAQPASPKWAASRDCSRVAPTIRKKNWKALMKRARELEKKPCAGAGTPGRGRRRGVRAGGRRWRA